MNDETQPTMTDDSHHSDSTESDHLRSDDGTNTDGETSTDGGTNTDAISGSRDLRTVLNYAALAGLVLFALISAVQAYSAVGSIITDLIAPAYRAFFRAAFNLAVLLVCVAGISYQLDRIT